MTINTDTAATLQDRAVYLVLEWGLLGSWKTMKVEDANVETDAESQSVGVRKRTVNKEALKEFRQLMNRVRAVLVQYTLPSLFRPGVHAVPLCNVEEVNNALKQALRDLEDVKENIRADWNATVEDARKRLGSLYREADYGNADETVSKISFSYRYVPIATTPDLLKQVAADIYSDDVERAKVETTRELESFRAGLRAALLEILINMQKTLTKPDGETRFFGRRFFKRLDNFLTAFDSKNLSDDDDLKLLVAKLRKVSQGTDIDLLKDDGLTQDKLNKKLSAIKKAVASMVEEGGRVIDLS
jgi:hypothetical protein